ncbi:MAG: glutamyl-tRNA amidotransferase [Cyanobacteriota bacterium]|nr:glutamyl-tRNA amidotransferase [Cyanobacteriota bacterium]
MSATDVIPLAVNGTLMRGLELSGNLLALGAEFDREDQTAPCYRLWSIDDRHPAMQRVARGGQAIALEIWRIPSLGLARLLLGEPQGLAIGRIVLADGSTVLGVLAEASLCDGQREITDFGGWRAYCSVNNVPPGQSTEPPPSQSTETALTDYLETIKPQDA